MQAQTCFSHNFRRLILNRSGFDHAARRERPGNTAALISFYAWDGSASQIAGHDVPAAGGNLPTACNRLQPSRWKEPYLLFPALLSRLG